MRFLKTSIEGVRLLAALFSISYLSVGLAGVSPMLAASDLDVNVSDSTVGTTFNGSEVHWTFRMNNLSEVTHASLNAGGVLLRVDFPAEIVAESVIFSGAAQFNDSDAIDCVIELNSLTCTANAYFALFEGGYMSYRVVTRLAGTGTVAIPDLSGVCRVNPDGDIVESNTDNNDCSRSVESRNPPAIPDRDWLTVTMWDNLMRVYDPGEDTVIFGSQVAQIDNQDVFSLNAIMRNPASGEYFVSHRYFQSLEHRLGAYEPATGEVTDIGPLGLAFHDFTFTGTGVLYGIGKNGVIYEIAQDTASVTARCTFDPGGHRALAWDSAAGHLLVIADYAINSIDPSGFPLDAETNCDSVRTGFDRLINGGIFEAEMVDGQLYVADDGGNFYLVGLDGAALQVGDPYFQFHGMVPEPLDLLKPAAPLPPESNVFDIAGHSVYALDPDDGSLVYQTTLDLKPDAATFTQNDYALIDDIAITRLGVGSTVPNTTLDTVPPYSEPSGMADSASSTSNVWMIDDIELVEYSTWGSIITAPRPMPVVSKAIARIEDEFIFVTGSDDDSTSMERYSVSAFPQHNASVPLTWGPGLQKTGFRRLWDLEYRETTDELMGIVYRTPFAEETGKASDLLPNVLVRIKDTGEVQRIAALPTTIRTLGNWYSGPVSTGGKFRYVFVSDGVWDGDLKTAGGGETGIDGANRLCQQHADAGGLAGEYRAWISDSNYDAKDWIDPFEGPYFLPAPGGGIAEQVVDDFTDLVSCTGDSPFECLDNPINRNEFGEDPGSPTLGVWTFTAKDGTAQHSSAERACADWTTNDDSGTCAGWSASGLCGSAGRSTHTSQLWTWDQYLNCDSQRRLYCVQISGSQAMPELIFKDGFESVSP